MILKMNRWLFIEDFIVCLSFLINVNYFIQFNHLFHLIDRVLINYNKHEFSKKRILKTHTLKTLINIESNLLFYFHHQSITTHDQTSTSSQALLS